MRESQTVENARRALGAQLAAYRRAAGYSQEAFAAHVDYSRSTIANVETGRQRVPRRFLFYWATIDDVTVDYENRQTTCSYSNVREINPPRQLSALQLRNGNRHLSDDYIRRTRSVRRQAFLPSCLAAFEIGRYPWRQRSRPKPR